jgi:hypothetical protein
MLEITSPPQFASECVCARYGWPQMQHEALICHAKSGADPRLAQRTRSEQCSAAHEQIGLKSEACANCCKLIQVLRRLMRNAHVTEAIVCDMKRALPGQPNCRKQPVPGIVVNGELWVLDVPICCCTRRSGFAGPRCSECLNIEAPADTAISVNRAPWGASAPHEPTARPQSALFMSRVVMGRAYT